MNLELTLTLQDCKNLLESEHIGHSAIILAHLHNQNPFDEIPDEKIQEFHRTWDKIKNFVEANNKE